MAEDLERAQRLKDIKAARPRLTWGEVADAADVKERSVLEWAKTGAMKYEHAEAVAAYLKVDLDWLWRGEPAEAPDLMGALSPTTQAEQLDLIQAKLDRLTDLVLELEIAAASRPKRKRGSGPAKAAGGSAG